MSELQLYYDSFKTGYWVDEDPEKCRCGGSGYALSEVDTWHECPEHYVPGQPHPEMDWYPDNWDQAAELAKYRARRKEEWEKAVALAEQNPGTCPEEFLEPPEHLRPLPVDKGSEEELFAPDEIPF
jgi:hypothetical protein